MKETLKTARKNLDQIIQKQIEGEVIENLPQIETLDDKTLYAWIPAITLLCPQELGTTSSRDCSGRSSQEIDSPWQNNDTNELPPESPIAPSFSNLNTPRINPF